MGFLSKLFSSFSFSSGVEQISTTQLKETLKDKKENFFIDVRTKGEFKANHIRGFENFPLSNLAKNTHKLPKDKNIVVICQSGGRSSSACHLLKKQGFEKVTNVQGGMSNWNK